MSSQQIVRSSYRFGSYVVLASQNGADGEPFDIVIYGPQKYKFNIAGHEALQRAFEIASELDSQQINHDRKIISCTTRE